MNPSSRDSSPYRSTGRLPRQKAGLLLTILAFLLGVAGIAGASSSFSLWLVAGAFAVALVGASMARPPTFSPTRAQKACSTQANFVALFAFIAVIGLFMLRSADNALTEAAVRSQISQAKSDLREIESALAAYRTANHTYPPRLLPALTTPVAFLKGPFYDPFSTQSLRPYFYETAGDSFLLAAIGPDGAADVDPSLLRTAASSTQLRTLLNERTYDPTNGMESRGDMLKVHTPTGE